MSLHRRSRRRGRAVVAVVVAVLAAGAAGSAAAAGAPGAKATAGPPRVELGEPVSLGSLTMEVVRAAVRPHLPDVQRCYATAPGPRGKSGRVVLGLGIDAAGVVKDVAVDVATLELPDVVACIAALARAWKFPKPPTMSYATTKVHVPFAFAPDDRTPMPPAAVEIPKSVLGHCRREVTWHGTVDVALPISASPPGRAALEALCANLVALADCYDHFFILVEDVKLELDVAYAPAAGAARVELVGDATRFPELKECVLRVVRGVTFPRPPVGTPTIRRLDIAFIWPPEPAAVTP